MSKIIIYSKNGCGQCLFTKKYLEKKGADFQERNISLEPEYVDEVKDLGFQALPVVVAEGHEPFSGYQPEKLDGLVE